MVFGDFQGDIKAAHRKKITFGNDNDFEPIDFTGSKKSSFAVLKNSFGTFLSKSIDGGETFDKPRKISDTNKYFSLKETTPSTIKNFDGVIYSSWIEQNSSGYDLYLSKSYDSGTSFSVPLLL